MSRTIIGIDLGTTNSLCAVFQEGEPRLIRNVHGEFLTPSVVGLLEDGQVLVGSPAKELRITQPEKCSSCFKRWKGTDQDVVLNGRKFNLYEEVIASIVKIGEDVDDELPRLRHWVKRPRA